MTKHIFPALTAFVLLLSGCTVSERPLTGGQSNVSPAIDRGKLPVLAEPFQQITTNGKAVLPSWSPDGEQIAFFERTKGWDEYTDTALTRLYVINRDGSGRRMLSQDTIAEGNASQPVWTPDGQRVLYDNSSNGRGIRMASVNSGEVITFVKDGMSPSFSVDGRLLAFHKVESSGEHYRDNVYIMPWPGSSNARLIAGLPVAENTEVCPPPPIKWSRGKDKILAVAGDYDSCDLWLISLESGEKLRLTRNGFNRCGSFSPDNRHIVWVQHKDVGQVSDSDILLADGEGMNAGKISSWGDVRWCGWIDNDNVVCLRGKLSEDYDSGRQYMRQWSVWILNIHSLQSVKISNGSDYALSSNGDIAVVVLEDNNASNIYASKLK